MLRRSTVSVALIVGMILGPTLVASPARGGLADVVPSLFDELIILAPPTGDFPSPETHFVDEGLALQATSQRLNESLALQLSTFPLASSAGGFTYVFDEELGVFTRTTDSFGPLFTERAQTLGKGKRNVGFTYLQASYDTLDDLDLQGGDLEFQLLHQDPAGDDRTDPFFEGDLINTKLYLEVDTETAVFFASYGLTERFDVSLAIPVQQVDLDARAELTIDRLATEQIPGIHRFPDGSDTKEFSEGGSASGIGDVLLRSKWRFAGEAQNGAALGLDLRLPTGNEDDLLGTGVTQGELFFAGSTSWGKLGSHLNVGYTASSGGSDVLDDVPDEIDYKLGFDLAVDPRLTLSAELVGRTLLDATRVRRVNREFVFTEGPGGPLSSALRPVVEFEEDDVDILLGAAGVKMNLRENLLVSSSFLYSLSDDGLADDGVILVFGLDYTY